MPDSSPTLTKQQARGVWGDGAIDRPDLGTPDAVLMGDPP